MKCAHILFRWHPTDSSIGCLCVKPEKHRIILCVTVLEHVSFIVIARQAERPHVAFGSELAGLEDEALEGLAPTD